MNKNGTMWLDTEGNPIQAHGGMILEADGIYYWYGENKNGPTLEDPNVAYRVDFIGISCYSSINLVDWKYEGIVLPASAEPGHDLYPDRVCERPKVIYNDKNKEYVMWMHIDKADYTYARAGYATSVSPAGPFTYHGSIRVNNTDTRDMTVFQDADGKAYLIHSSDWNRTLRICELTDDYKSFTGRSVKVLADQWREAPAPFYCDGIYYMVTSGCTGWDPNAALYAISEDLLGSWRLIDNPCSGPLARSTYYGQSTYVFEKDGHFYLMLDHWKPSDLKNSGYSILPVQIEKGKLEIPWSEEIPFTR